MKQFLEIGEFVTTHGITGELKLYPWCDSPAFVAALPRIFLREDGGQELRLESVRAHKNMCIIKLAGVDDIDAARTYLRKTAYFARADAPLPEGRYYVQDVIGCRVLDADTGVCYGTVTDVAQPAAHDVYTVTNDAGETFLFPAVEEFLVSLTPEQGVMTVRPIPGMFTNIGGNDDAD